jgi:hypothetical protein
MPTLHRWKFFRAGGFDQVKLETGEDFVELETLDQKLWVALACPAEGLELDRRTIQLIDRDKDGRIRAPELLAAVKLACTHLREPGDLLKGRATLALAAISDATPESKILRAAARRILDNLGKAEASEIGVEDLADPVKIFANTAFNGDGIITELSANADAAARAAIKDAVDCFGGEADRAGIPGVGQATIDAFFGELDAYRAWHARSEGADGTRALLPLDEGAMAAAVAAIERIRAKVDDYFGRCRLAAFDPRTVTLLNRSEEEYLTIAGQDLTITADEVAAFPLAQVAAGRPLNLTNALNPAHAAAVDELRRAAILPLLGERAELTEEDWATLKARVAPYQAWQAEMPSLKVNRLGAARIRELQGSGLRTTLVGLVAADNAISAEAAAIEDVERLVRYHRDLAQLCSNFVNFKAFYGGAEPAVFQTGTLYLDQRACKLCLPVDDAARHATLAGLAGVYLAYLDCVRKATGEKRQIVAAFTNGDSDNLMIGRNGLFYDRQGRDWDATITKIIDNPISVRQAFWAPYKKLARFIEEQVAKRASAADAKSHTALAATAATTVNLDSVKPPEPKKVDVGTVAALGVAVGAVGAFATGILGYATGIFRLGVLPTLGAIAGVILLISLPSVVLAYMKLRKRNLGPILDANGWAVNAKAKVSVPFGATLTAIPRLPPGARRDSSDRFAEKPLPWKPVVFILVVAYLAYHWSLGSFDRFLPEPGRARTVLGAWFPAPSPPARSGP